MFFFESNFKLFWVLSKNIKTFRNFIFFAKKVFYFAKDNIVNPVINPLAKQNKNLTIVFYKKVGGLVNLSLRRGDYKVNLPELIKYAISEEPSASGGGHVPASGASFPAPYLETFKERVKTYLKEKYNNENN